MDHNFADSLQFSFDCQNAPFWEIAYRQFFPAFQTMVNVRQDGPHQRAGVDRLVVLTNGRQVQIDEKARRKTYDDFALETISDEDRRTPGWVCKPLICEFIAYAKVPQQRCWLLPTLPLQTAYTKFGSEWQRRFGTIVAHNHDPRSGRRWRTRSVLVPNDALFACLKNVLCASWAPPRVQSSPIAPCPEPAPSTQYTRQDDLFGRGTP